MTIDGTDVLRTLLCVTRLPVVLLVVIYERRLIWSVVILVFDNDGYILRLLINYASVDSLCFLRIYWNAVH
jgi:hypothetical protein